MKKLILWAALVLPFSLQAQQDIPADVLAKMPTYVQLSQMGYAKGLKFSTSTTVGATASDTHTVLGSDGKDYAFTTDAEAANYMDRQGYEFVDYPVMAAMPGVSVFRVMLFKKR